MIRDFLVRLLQRSDILRILGIPVLFIMFFFAVSGVVQLAHQKPVIVSMSPSIAGPGEVLLIKGRHFGSVQGDNWIEIGGDRLSGNSYIKWTDTTIMATLPAAVADGLVFVCNRNGKSNPQVFANRDNIPVAARTNNDVGLPVIDSFNAASVSTGQLLTILGKNFGITRGNSEVRFSWLTTTANTLTPSIPLTTGQTSDTSTIACSDHDFCYELWSDNELHVRIPDGATSGIVFVKTERGTSNQMSITITDPSGVKHYDNRRTYSLSLEVDITNVLASDGNMLFLRIPVPQETATQHGVKITASSPPPYMENYRGTILHQIENLKTARSEKVTHSFLLTAYSVSSTVNQNLVQSWQDTQSPLYLMYTAPDRIIPSDSKDVITASALIVGKETNPYKKSMLIYSWIAKNIEYRKTETPDRTITQILSTKNGDALDLAILYTSLSRAAGIPAIPVAGILVDAKQSSRIHWWAEFYLENFGWLPVDPGLALETGNTEAYFGQQGADHIAFSRGWTDQKPMTPKSRIVYKPHSFAFQPVWEESGGNIKSYTSFWAEPKVTGVY